MTLTSNLIVGDEIRINPDVVDEMLNTFRNEHTGAFENEYIVKTISESDLNGYILEVDYNWLKPYTVYFYNEDIRKLVEQGVIPELYHKSQLVKIEKLETKQLENATNNSEDTKDNSVTIYIRDMGNNKSKNVCLIDLKNGVSRLNMVANESDDIMLYIKMNRPNKVIFDIHDATFKWFMRKYADTMIKEYNFIIEENGDIVWKD